MDMDMEHNIFDEENNQFVYEYDMDNNLNINSASAWVFGYGSLCWYPGFIFSKCVTGYIRGYSRKFWQGNVTHRGTTDKPGRVATLVEDKDGLTWGCAYKITGDTALEYLKQRECTLGGYITLETKFYPRLASGKSEINGSAIPVILYIATDKNNLWLGDETIENIGKQICYAKGPSGHNAEYVLRLTKFMKDEIPEAFDEHLFKLEEMILDILEKNQIPLISVMGPTSPQRIRRDSHEDTRQLTTTFEFTSRIPKRKLRCLNI